MRIPEKAMYLVIIVLLITVGTFGWFLRQKTQTLIEVQEINRVLTDTVEIERNNKGQYTAKIAALETAKVKDLLKIKSQDKTIKWLQETVRDNQHRLGPTGSVTVFDSKTSLNVKTPTIVIPKDTSHIASTHPSKPDTLKLYPEYLSMIALGKWVTGSVKANKDSTSLMLKVLNEYEVVSGTEKVAGTGFLGIGGKKRSFAEVTNLNPYSESSTIRTYNVKENNKVKRIGIGPSIGYNPFGKEKVYFGVGINYNFISLL